MGKYVAWLSVPVFGLLLVLGPSIGCGGGGGVPPPTCAPATIDLTGTWEITETELGNNCGEAVPPPNTYTAVVTQVGNTVTAVGGGETRVFTICGDTIIVPGSTTPEDGGLTVTPPLSASFTDPNTWTGTNTWTWSDGVTTCSGDFQITATRL